MKKEMDEGLSFMKTRLDTNTTTLNDVKAIVSRLKADMVELSEKSNKEQRLMEQRFNKDEDINQNTTDTLKNLKRNVKELFDEYNDRH